jgi:tetratricopeptide (TPR) repeat protein
MMFESRAKPISKNKSRRFWGETVDPLFIRHLTPSYGHSKGRDVCFFGISKGAAMVYKSRKNRAETQQADEANRYLLPAGAPGLGGRTITLLTLLLACSIAAESQTPTLVEDLYRRAERRVREKDFDGAITDFTRVIELISCIQSGKKIERPPRAGRKSSGPEAADIAVLDPRAALAYTARGIIKTELEDFDGALADLNSALRISPRAADAWFARGRVWHLKNELARAIGDYNRALHLDSRYSEAYHNRANLLAEQGKLREALVDFDQAIRFNPREAVTYGNRGRVRLALFDLLGAEADFKRAIEIDPRAAQFHFGLGLTHFNECAFEQAISDFTAALRLNPQLAEAYLNRGLAQLLNEDDAKAATDFSSCLELKPALRTLLEQRIDRARQLRSETLKDFRCK